jgi:hypothetical protein
MRFTWVQFVRGSLRCAAQQRARVDGARQGRYPRVLRGTSGKPISCACTTLDGFHADATRWPPGARIPIRLRRP